MQERHYESWTSMRLRPEVKKRLEEFCERKQLSQGAGVMTLLDFFEEHQGGRDAP